MFGSKFIGSFIKNNEIFNYLKRFWMGLKGRCECGGYFYDYDYKRSICDKCGRVDS
jgi:hypothetical protein